MADETTGRYLFVAIDRATRWVFVRILPAKTAANARRFLRDRHRARRIRIARILTDRAIETPMVQVPMARGKEFTDRLFASRAPSGTHEFDQISRTGHRAPPDPAEITPNQRHGRALQRPHQRRAENQPLRQRP